MRQRRSKHLASRPVSPPRINCTSEVGFPLYPLEYLMGAVRGSLGISSIVNPIRAFLTNLLPTQPSFALLASPPVRSPLSSRAIAYFFLTGAFHNWAPNLYKYYVSHLADLLTHDKTIHRAFPHSAWAAATFNFGPATVCFKHTDNANLPFGWCGITSLGSFDPKLGGHLILWDLHLVIEFPAGSTILIPSASIAHANVPIQLGEKRYSFTQYTAGGIFRWVDNAFQKKDKYFDSLSTIEHEAVMDSLSKQLDFGLSLLPKVNIIQPI